MWLSELLYIRFFRIFVGLFQNEDFIMMCMCGLMCFVVVELQ